MTGKTVVSHTRCLVLVPTAMERDAILAHWASLHSDVKIDVCGLGVVAASVNTASLIEQCQPRRVILAGIAGVFSAQKHQLGAAVSFGSVAIDGVGVGQGDQFLSPTQLGWDDPSYGCPPGRLKLRSLSADAQMSDRSDDCLLTVCSASANSREAEWRMERFPDAVAEDMEGYAVALACQTMRIELSVIRGLSNFVGERDKAKWKIRESLQAVAVSLKQTMESD